LKLVIWCSSYVVKIRTPWRITSSGWPFINNVCLPNRMLGTE
jgi:hypothetical protein